MGAAQAHYSSVAEGPGGRAGWQFTGWTPSLGQAQLAELERLMSYAPPGRVSPDAGQDVIDALPVSLQLQKLSTGETVLVRVSYLGRDYSGRPGNFFGQALVMEGDTTPLEAAPLALLDGPWWARSPQTGDLDEVDLAPGFSAGEFEGLAERLMGRLDRRELTLFLSGAGLASAEGNAVLIVDEPAAVPEWLGLFYLVLPQQDWWEVGFNTYAGDLRRSGGRLRFTTPGNRQAVTVPDYELSSTTTLIEPGGDSGGRETVFGQVASELLAAGDLRAVTEIGRLARMITEELSPDGYESAAVICAPEQQLTSIDFKTRIEALKTVSLAPESVLSAEDVSRLLEKAPASQSADVVALLANAASTPGANSDLVATGALSWVLRTDPSASIPLEGIEVTPAGWSSIWPEATSRVPATGLAACVNAGLRLELDADAAAAEKVGALLGSRIASGEVEASTIGSISYLRGPLLEGLTDQLSDGVLGGRLDPSVLASPAVRDELAVRLSGAGDFTSAVRLLELLSSSGVPPDYDRAEFVLGMAGTADELGELVKTLRLSGSLPADFVLKALDRCGSLGSVPPRSLLDEVDVILEACPQQPAAAEIALAEKVAGRGGSSATCEAILLVENPPASSGDTLSWVGEATRLLSAELPAARKQALLNESSVVVASTLEPAKHAQMLTALLDCAGEPARDSYLEALAELVRTSDTAAPAVAVAASAWPLVSYPELDSANFDRLAQTLGSAQREEVSDLLSGVALSDWEAWCEENDAPGALKRAFRRRGIK